MKDCDLIRDFLNYLKLEKHLSPQTARCYTADLDQFTDFLISQTPDNTQTANRTGPTSVALATEPKAAIDQRLLSVDTHTIRTFLDDLDEKQYTKVTTGRKLAALRCFYKFLTSKHRIDSNPALPVKIPIQPKKPPTCLTPEQVRRLLDAPSTDNWLGARDKAILQTLYSTGLRVSELVMLNIEDVDFLGELVRIGGNGKKQRVTPIASSALQSIQRYFEFRNKRFDNDPQHDAKVLFVNRNGKRLNTRSIRRKMDKYLAIAGLDPSVSPHTLRHTYAAHMLDNGADLSRLRELLGHQSLASTQLYTELTTK